MRWKRDVPTADAMAAPAAHACSHSYSHTLAAKALLLCAGVSADTRGAQACAALPALHASSSARATGLHVSLSPPAEKGELPPACDVAALAVRVQAARALLPHLRFSRNDAVCAFLRCHHH